MEETQGTTRDVSQALRKGSSGKFLTINRGRAWAAGGQNTVAQSFSLLVKFKGNLKLEL